MKKLIVFFSLFFFYSIIFAQSFLISSAIEDTIVFNSKISDIKVGDLIYDYNTVGEYRDSTYVNKFRILKVAEINKYDFEKNKLREECRAFFFDSYLKYKVLYVKDIFVSDKYVFNSCYQSALKQTFVVHFNKKIKKIEIDKGKEILSNDSININLKIKILDWENFSFKIVNYGFASIYFDDNTIITIYNVECKIKEGQEKMFYIVSKDNKIIKIYNYYNS